MLPEQTITTTSMASEKVPIRIEIERKNILPVDDESRDPLTSTTLRLRQNLKDMRRMSDVACYLERREHIKSYVEYRENLKCAKAKKPD